MSKNNNVGSQFSNIKNRKNPNDKIYTPKSVALKMIELCEITENMTVLDPSRGGGIFYDNLPKCNKDYCEIEEGKDFFEYNKKVDLIIGNPPFSLWNKWIDHTMKLTNKFCYIMGCLNFSDKRIRYIIDNGFGITKMHLLKIDWWFAESYIVIFEKNKSSIITVEDKKILCDICNKKCKRGRNGHSPNKCTNIN
jgi:type I restriction-modification system DNA methylase subunit